MKLPSQDELSHGALVAVLMHHGGSMTLPADAFEDGTMGPLDGSFYAVTFAAVGEEIRLTVVPAGGGS